MKIHIDVLDAAGNRTAEGPITTATSVSITRELSGTGSISISVPATDYNAISELTNERRVNIYAWDDDEKAEKRLIGSGIIRKFAFNRDAAGDTLTVSGPDILDELKRVNTWLAWQKNNTAIATIASNLIALASGWSADTTDIPALDPLSIRLDGASVLKGMQELCSQKGIHFRLGEGKEVEFGDFGDDSGLILIEPGNYLYPHLQANEDVAIVERLTFDYDTEAVANKIVVMGPGDGEAALSLKFSTRTTPYTIGNMTVNGLTLYYLSDAASVTEYGQIEKMFKANGIAALSNSQADIENASDALYDVAANWLSRNCVRQEVYKVSLRNVKQNIKPGQTVRLEFMGMAVDAEGEPVRWVNLRDDYWVLSVTERLELQGRVVDLQLSNVDRVQMDSAKLIIGALDDIDTRNTIVKPYLNMYMQPLMQESIDSTHNAIFPFSLGDYVARLNQVILRLWTRPFRANVTGAASGGGSTSSAGGDHKHRMFVYNSGIPSGTFNPTFFVTGDGPSSYQDVKIEVSANKDMYTYDASGNHTHTISAHTHPMTYGIYDDTSTPATIRVYVDNVEVSGSPYAAGGGNQALEIDITSLFDEIGFQGSHEIKVTCGSGQGLVFGHIEVRQTIQSIRVI